MLFLFLFVIFYRFESWLFHLPVHGFEAVTSAPCDLIDNVIRSFIRYLLPINKGSLTATLN